MTYEICIMNILVKSDNIQYILLQTFLVRILCHIPFTYPYSIYSFSYLCIFTPLLFSYLYLFSTIIFIFFFFFIFFFLFFFFFFFFNDTATTEIYTLSLHDALPI